jgi:tetratricopeptide (TPR) repeat protein
VRKLNTYIGICGLLFVLGTTSCSLGKKAIDVSGDANETLTGRQKVMYDEAFFNALSAKYAGDNEVALEYFQKCLSIHPNSNAVKYELSQIFVKLNYLENAEVMARDIVNSDPENRWYLENLARIYQTSKKFDKSAEVYEKLVSEYPNEITYYYELGSVYLYSNNASGAIQTYENLESIIGFENSLAEQLYKLYAHQGMDSKAEEKLLEIIKMNPTDVKYVGMLASYYKGKGETQKAVDLYENLKRDHPNDPYVKLALYEYYHELGETETAFENLEAAFQSDQVNIDSKVGILLALMDLSERDKSVKSEVFELMEIMTKVHENEAKTWALYGDFLYNNQKKSEARVKFLKSIELDDSKYQVWNQVLFIDSELNDVDAIITHSESCIELFPNQVLPHYFNGIGRLQKEQFPEAIESLEMAKELAVGMTELEIQIMANLGDAYYQVKNYQKSWLSYDHSLRMNPNNDYVLNNYAYFLSVQGEQLDKALEMSGRTVERNPNSAIYLDTYGWIFYKMNKYVDAENNLIKAVKADQSKSGEILEHLGDAQFRQGKIEDALNNWKMAEQVGGGSSDLGSKIKNKKIAE